MILLQTDMTYEKQFRNYHIQEARLHRRRDKDMAELRRLQQERKANETPESVNRAAANLSTPENGFEFSNPLSTATEDLSEAPEHPLAGEKAA
jgi:hypothetical protein